MTNTTATLALALDTTPRTLRKFLRSADSGIASVGKGSRYALPASKREVNALKKRFTAWGAAQDAAREAKAIKVAEAPEVEVTPDFEEALNDADALPDFDDLECPLDA